MTQENLVARLIETEIKITELVQLAVKLKYKLAEQKLKETL